MNKTFSLTVRFFSILTILGLLLGILGVVPARAAGILYVTPAGTGDCSDWANACSLQTALTNAISGDEIWVQAGVYKPTTDTDRAATFQLKSGVAVYGGFAGIESARDERDFTVNITTLSGDLLGNDNDTILPDEPARADNSYHVVIGASGAILDGFTVTAGNANGSTEETNQGGGLYNLHSNTIIHNVIFSENTASAFGGGIYAYESQPQFKNITFMNNWGAMGGGMANWASSSILTDVQFINNYSYMGGGMRNMSGSNATLTRVAFSKNSAGIGGGMNNLESNPTLIDVTFVENTATEWAGLGGGMHNSESAPLLTNVTFDRNVAIYGGGIENDRSSPVLKNVTFSGNSAQAGGGEYDFASSPTIINVTFTGNSATDRGGGIFNPYETATRIDNTIFWNNTAPNGGAQIWSYAWTISNTVLEGGCPEQLTCTNIITTDPKLGVLDDYGGFTPTIPLLAGSSAIDAGNDLDCPETDQRGVIRPQGAHCDIGAFEVSRTLFVTPQGTGDCSDWVNACSLQTALTNAISGDEIWVQAGVYKPTLGADRAATFQLKSGVAVYGGFAGTESARSERDFTVNITALSGDLLGNDNDTILPDEPTRADNSYHVVTGASGAILDGFTVTAGNANGSPFPNDSGGGVLDMNSGSNLTNILFFQNTTSMGGGGVFSGNSDTVLANVTFRENYGIAGGGMYTYSPSNNLSLTRVTFDGNSSATNGGGIFVGQGNSTLTDVSFISNSADMGGGLYNESDGLVMNNITFFDNSALTYGGGMMQSWSGHVSLINATFTDNSAENGGGLANFAHDTGSTLTNNTFSGNTANSNGGGIYTDGYLEVYNAILWGNIDLSGLQSYDKLYSTISDSVIQGECSIYTVCTNITTDDPLLGTLGDYGGFTQTIPIEEGSPAIDATSNNCPATDQRGLARSNPACDIGAYEIQPSNVLYATPDGLTSGACSSWDNACDLQYALTTAVSGQEIWVQAGLYKPTTGTDRTATFLLKSGVSVYGGFSGTESARSERDFATNVTTLSGDLEGNDNDSILPDEPTRADNSYHVVTGASGAILDGFTVTAGNANGETSSYHGGGGLYNFQSDPVIQNVIFSSNTAHYAGGGIYDYESQPQLENVTFINNWGGIGGGMDNEYSSPILTNVTFVDNSAYMGAGMRNNFGSNPMLTNVIFKSNSAANGGGLNNYSDSNPILISVVFDGNTASGDNNGSGGSGGAMLNVENSKPILVNVEFLNNMATYGGGIYNSNSSPILTDVTFSENSAMEGGGIYGTYYQYNHISELTNVTFTDNSVDGYRGPIRYGYGGGIYDYGGNLKLLNVTFGSNTASDSGGGIYSANGTLDLKNITFTNNSANYSGGGILNASSDVIIKNSILWQNISPHGAQIYSYLTTPVVSDSVIQDGYTGGTNIITDDPKLGALGDYGGFTQTVPLLAGSSAIDAGNDNACFITDQRGISRPQGLHCDIGAYEAIEDDTAPETSITDAPSTFDNDNTPTYTFSGDDGPNSGISTFSCSVDGNPYVPCVSPYTLSELSDGPHTFDVYAIDLAGNADLSPATHAWTVETVAPETSFLTTPPVLDNDITPTFTFDGDDGAGSGLDVFLCRVDTGEFAPCSSPFTSSTLIDGPHTFEVYAIDLAGNADLSPASHTWTLDTVAPETSILTTPPALDNDNTPTFTFDGNDGTGSGSASFRCKVDNNSFATCTSPFTLPALVDGPHSFEVYAVDLAGNADSSPATYAWNIETAAPSVISITRVNPSPTDLASVDFTVTFSKPVTGVDMTGPDFDDFTLTTSAGISGAAVTQVNGSGNTYTVTVNTGAGNGTFRLDVGTSGHIVDAANNPLTGAFTSGESYGVIKTATFGDAPDNYWASSFIERLYYSGITGGCSTSPLMYCPEASVTRAQMAVFLLVAEHGAGYIPPDATGAVFNDVSADNGFARWIEQLAAEGITGGCGNGNYCPNAPVTRAQMAVFLLVAEHGTGYTPPAATGVFTDVPVDNAFAPWVEQLAAEGITGGCGGGNFCPNTVVTRAQMAVFLVTAFHLP